MVLAVFWWLPTNGLLSNPREVLVEKKYNCLGQGNNHVKVTAFSPEGITSFAVADYFYGSQEILKNIDIDVDSSFMPETNQIKLYMTGTVMNTAISRYVLELLTNICSVQDTLPLTYLTDEDGLYYNPDGKTSAEKTYSCLAEGDNKVKVTAFSPEGITAVVEKTYGYNPAVPSGSPPTASISFSEILGLEQKVNLSITATDPDSDIKLVYLDVYNSETQSSARTTLLSNTLLGSFSTQTFAFYGKGKNTYILTVADSKSHTVQQSISAVCDNATDSDAITVITNELNSRGFVVTYNYTTVLQNQIQIIADVYGKNDPKFCEVAIDYKPDEDAQVFAENKDMPYTLTIPLGTEYEVYTTLTGFLDKNCPD